MLLRGNRGESRDWPEKRGDRGESREGGGDRGEGVEETEVVLTGWNLGARLDVTAATAQIGELLDQQTKLKSDSAAKVQKLVGQYQNQAKDQIGASKATLKATKQGLGEEVDVAQRQEQEAREKAKIALKELRGVQDTVSQLKAVLQSKQAEEMKMLNEAHAQLAKADDAAQAQVQQQKGQLGSEVTVARQQAVQAHDGVPRLRDSVVAARVALQEAQESRKYSKTEMQYHAKAAEGAENELARIKLELPAAKEAVQLAKKRVADATKQTDVALKTASGDTTTVKLKHQRAQEVHAATVQKLADVNRAIGMAEANEALAAATLSELGHAATKAENDAIAQKGIAKTAVETAEEQAKQVSHS